MQELTLTDLGLELRLLGILLGGLLRVNLLGGLVLFLMFPTPKVKPEGLLGLPNPGWRRTLPQAILLGPLAFHIPARILL